MQKITFVCCDWVAKSSLLEFVAFTGGDVIVVIQKILLISLIDCVTNMPEN